MNSFDMVKAVEMDQTIFLVDRSNIMSQFLILSHAMVRRARFFPPAGEGKSKEQACGRSREHEITSWQNMTELGRGR